MTMVGGSDTNHLPLTGSSAPTSRAPASVGFARFEKRDIEQSISSRFEQQVRRFPDKVAVRTTRESLTYAQLNWLANRIAQLILTNSNTDNQPVALLFGQSALLIAAILGTLKAGKLYVPLDPLQQASWNIDILADSSATMLLTEPSQRQAKALRRPGLDVLDLTAISDKLSAEKPDLEVGPDRLAYLFYTSGSTGKPKGIADTHRNVLHNIMRYTNNLTISADDRLTLLQSASFSGSVSSLFCALLNGATSFPFSLQMEGADRLASWVSQERISIYHSVPSIFRLLATGKHSYPALRVIRLEGDQASPRDIELYKTFFPDSCVLVNGLGATECGIVRQYFVTKDTPVPESIVPIGHAVEDMDLMLLDEFGQPLGVGCVGEIAIRSAYLAPGYWRRHDLTAAAFLPDPRGGTERVYKTGDLGRLRADDCLEYLGRKSFQLRIRGQWVEIPEVEAALRRLNAFKDVAVVALEDKKSEPRLVAYLVPRERQSPQVDELRRQLGKHLPTHMIPSAFVTLDALPLTPHGKVDRRALPALRWERPVLTQSYIPPQTVDQLQLQKIWEDILQIRPIGMRDSFFDLGGDSLRALNMLDDVQQATGKTILPEVMLEGATIEHLADHINGELDERRAPIIEIQNSTSRKAFYFLHGDYTSGGHYSVNLARHLGRDRPFYAMPPCGVNGYPVPDSYEEMAKLHVQVLRATQPVGPYMLGGTCNGGLVAYEMARQLVAEGERVDALILIAASVFNLRLMRLRQAVSLLGILSQHAESRAFALGRAIYQKFYLLPPAGLPKFLLTKALQQLVQRHPWITGDSASGQDHSEKMNGPTSRIALRTALREGRRETYQRIDRRYRPGSYPGKVTVFWWEGEDEGPDEGARCWSEVAGSVELHRFHGGRHPDFITGNIEIIATKLRACLDAAD